MVHPFISVGDCVESMRKMPDGFFNTCVTSPPYFGLRDYGVDGQIGLEDSPELFVQKMVEVFREVKRVLRDDGTLWLNLGDSYGSTGGDTYSGFNERYHGNGAGDSKQNQALNGVKERKLKTSLRPKNLLGIPWRVALALQADGWYLRQDIIWSKPNPMPESVRDRCTKSHEYVFLLSKSPKYYFGANAIKEPSIWYGKDARSGKGNFRYEGKRTIDTSGKNGQQGFSQINETRNKRSVWYITTKPYKGAHFATFPPDLIEPCVLAGCPEYGWVLDPFLGSGTTALVAERHKRLWMGCELNPEYAELATKRIEGGK